jgi:molybdate transport system substrate-binding protein
VRQLFLYHFRPLTRAPDVLTNGPGAYAQDLCLRLLRRLQKAQTVAWPLTAQNPAMASNISRFLLVLLAFALLAGACQRHPSNELIVSAAVSLKDAFNEIGALYTKRTGRTVRFNFGASGALQKQIESGAPVDVFASAGVKEMDELFEKSLIAGNSRKNFASNRLALIEPPEAPPLGSFTDLTKPEIKKIAVGNPKTVPAGQYTQQALEHLHLLPSIQPKLIYAEDVHQVLDYVSRGEVDAGVVYSSDADASGKNIKIVAYAADNSHDLILYPIAIIKDSNRREAAQEFIDLVLSAEGHSILVQHGFLSANQ